MTRTLFAGVGLWLVLGPCCGPWVRAQAVAFQPVVTPFPSGVSLGVTPTVSADRRYVRMGIGVSFTNLLGFDTYSVPAAVSGTGGMNGAIGGLGGIGMGVGGGPGAGGLRAAGLGEARVAGGDPRVEFGQVAGDPFARAAAASSDRPARAAQTLSPEVGPRSNHSPRAKAVRRRGQGSALARKSKKARPKPAQAIQAPRGPSADFDAFPDAFSFEP